MAYTVTELAELAGCSRAYVKAEIGRGNLKARRIGHQYSISNTSARAWLNKARRGSRSKTKGTQHG